MDFLWKKCSVNWRNILMPIKLYHGTPYTLATINLEAGRGYKDFGKGFYLAFGKQQAIGMMNKKYRESSRKSPDNLSWIKKNLYSFDFKKELKRIRAFC